MSWSFPWPRSIRVVPLIMLIGLIACDGPPGMMAPKSEAMKTEAAFIPAGQPTADDAPAEGKKAELNTEDYQHFVDNPFLPVKVAPLSTFSVDVNTASYANVRRYLMQEGKLPPPDAVRIAELVNYFSYDYPQPKGDDPIAVGLELAPCPWQANHKLLRIAIAGRKLERSQLPPRNFVFLIDSSGSMADTNKLPLVQQSLGLLIDTLTERDTVSVVTYAGDSRIVLPATKGNEHAKIRAAVNSLRAGGSTNGGGGIVAAYDEAMKNRQPGGMDRVILMTDGDFNVGISDHGELVRLIEQKRNTGVFLTLLGFGRGNLKDRRMEEYARHGNGHYGYIDSLDEARKIFIDQGGALVAVAKDVKLQIEFNPLRVGAYRLIGYENRLLRDQDFKDDSKDAGDMGSGHEVTALYEIVPAGVKLNLPGVDPLKYADDRVPNEAAASGEWLTLKLRYKQPDGATSKEMATVLPADGEAKNPSNDFRFVSAVTAWGMLLRQSPYKGNSTLDSVEAAVQASRGRDADGRRAEFLRLVQTSKSLMK